MVTESGYGGGGQAGSSSSKNSGRWSYRRRRPNRDLGPTPYLAFCAGRLSTAKQTTRTIPHGSALFGCG